MHGPRTVAPKGGIGVHAARVLAFVSVIWLVMVSDVYGGESTLRGFERDATRPTAHGERHGDRDPDREESDLEEESDGGSFVGSFLGSLVGALLDVHDGTSADPASDAAPVLPKEPSAEAVPDTTPPADTPPREPYAWRPGSGFTPRLRVDYGQMRISSHIGATVVSVEGGDDRLGFLVRDTLFEERDPDATLRVRNYFVLLRMVGTGTPELDLGVGGTELNGVEENSGIGYVARVRAESQEGWTFEGQHGGTSINGNELTDTEVGLSLERQYAALRGGYRWLKSPAMLLDGPYIGISLRY